MKTPRVLFERGLGPFHILVRQESDDGSNPLAWNAQIGRDSEGGYLAIFAQFRRVIAIVEYVP